jgi:hypothetical protein
MRKYELWLPLLWILLWVPSSRGQVYTSEDVKFAMGFTEYFNRGDYSTIYHSYCSKQLRKNWSFENAMEAFAKLHKESGSISRIGLFESYNSSTGSQSRVWPVEFERGDVEVQLVADGLSVTDIVTRSRGKPFSKPATK